MKKSLTTNSETSIINQERRWLLGFALSVLAITTLPYIVGYVSQGDEWRFTGFVFGVEDGNSYIGKMLRGANGDWLFRSPYTSKDQRGAFVYFLYLILGKLSSSKGQHEQLIIIFHGFRILGGILSIYAIYDFVSLFVKDHGLRRWGVLLATLWGGLGWFLVLIGKKDWMGSLPIDFISPESFGFLGIYGIAHLSWSRAFFFWGLRAYLIRGYMGKAEFPQLCKLANIHPGVLWLLTGIAQPISAVVIGIVAGFHMLGIFVRQSFNHIKGKSGDWIVVKRYISTGLEAGLIALPLVAYNAAAFSLDPFLKIWLVQNQLPTPNGLHYLAAYGLMIPFVIVGINKILITKNEIGYLLVVWVIISPIMLLIPFSIQRRLAEGLWVVLVILCLAAYEKCKNPNFRRSYVIMIFNLPTTLFLLAGGLMVASRPQEPIFRPIDEVAAFEFLAERSGEHDVVLSAYETGNALPAWAPVFVVIGHGPESAGIKEIAPRVKAFYQEDTSDSTRISLLDEFDVDYVFWGPVERLYGDWDPGIVDFLELVFQQGDYQIYKVIVIIGND